jgi:hypothetical protein
LANSARSRGRGCQRLGFDEQGGAPAEQGEVVREVAEAADQAGRVGAERPRLAQQRRPDERVLGQLSRDAAVGEAVHDQDGVVLHDRGAAGTRDRRADRVLELAQRRLEPRLDRHGRVLADRQEVGRGPPLDPAGQRDVDLAGATTVRGLTVAVQGRAAPFVSFWADRTEINPGECTTLRWRVEGVRAVYLRTPEGSAGVVGQGERGVCPRASSAYSLDVIDLAGAITAHTVTVQVPR